MNRDKRIAIFQRLRELNPEPRTELEYASPFELLVAVVLSAQATDRSVNLATRKLFADANTPQALARLGVQGLEPYIRTIGLYRSKARHLIELAQRLIEHHHGTVPDDRESLEALPGVGRKTANVVLNTIFRQPTMAVDTHIFRVGNRTGIAPGRTPREVEDRLLRLVPQEFLLDAHHWLILLGRYVCKARKPECWRCPIQAWCEYRPKTPAPGAAAPSAEAESAGR